MSAQKQQAIEFDRLNAKNVVYDKDAENEITVTPDSTSASHFYATISNGEFTRLIRFYSKIPKIHLKKLDELEKDEEIRKDGPYSYQYKNNKTQRFYRMGKQEGEEVSFYKDTLFSVSRFHDDKLQKKDLFYPDGKLRATTLREYLSEEDIRENVAEYYPDGQLKREETYGNNSQLLEQRNYTPDGRDTTFALPFQRMAEFPGGDAALMYYLKKNIRYPGSALRRGISGRVILRFVVEEDGLIGKIDVLQSLSRETDKEAIRVTKNMPRWIPGIQHGEPVPVFFSLPIAFALTNYRR